MERQQFKKFCEKEFELQGFKKKKNMFYLKVQLINVNRKWKKIFLKKG